jgi:prefoldin subunit 5
MEHREALETISVSRAYLESLQKQIRDLKDHVAALQATNKELTDAVNEVDEQLESF